MRKLMTLYFLIIVIIGCKKEEKINFQYVTSKFKEYSNQIEKVEYHIHRIDTFAQGGVWNNKGIAFLQKDRNDDVFGFSFYGKRDDIPQEYVYDKGTGFEISKEDKSYQITPGHFGFLGTPGGQMVAPHVFYLDSIFKSAELINTEDKYVLKYTFADDSIYDVTDRIKIIELNKSNFFPTKIIESSKGLDNRAVRQVTLSDIKINSEVKNSIADYKNQIAEFEIIQQEEVQPNKILHGKLPPIKLANLLDERQTVTLRTEKPTLIDFWEPWCGPCIKSFPEVEKIKKRYDDQLQVVGIVTDDKVKALELIEKKKTSFLNLIGNKELLKAYNVNSFPRYFLIDKDGVVQKEYFGFTEQIEADVKELISK